MSKTFKIGFSPAPCFGETDIRPIIVAWKQAAQLLENFIYKIDSIGEHSVNINFNDVLDCLNEQRKFDEGDHSSLEKRFKRMISLNDDMAYLVINLNKNVDKDTATILIKSIIQEMFLALNLCASGAGHLNAANCSEIDSGKVIGYYGDMTESAWIYANNNEWPALKNIEFHEVWGWLDMIEFRNCTIAEKPIHKVMVMLLEPAEPQEYTAPLETVLLARALETLLQVKSGSTSSISVQLKNRIELLLNESNKNKKWLSDFYNLRSRVAHGDYPLLRPGITSYDEEMRYQHRFWKPIHGARAVILTLLQLLILKQSEGFEFHESVSYRSNKKIAD